MSDCKINGAPCNKKTAGRAGRGTLVWQVQHLINKSHTDRDTLENRFNNHKFFLLFHDQHLNGHRELCQTIHLHDTSLALLKRR